MGDFWNAEKTSNNILPSIDEISVSINKQFWCNSMKTLAMKLKEKPQIQCTRCETFLICFSCGGFEVDNIFEKKIEKKKSFLTLNLFFGFFLMELSKKVLIFELLPLRLDQTLV